MLNALMALAFSLLVIPAHPTPISLNEGDRIEIWVPYNERNHTGGEWAELVVKDGGLRFRGGGFLHDGTLLRYVWRKM